MRITNLNISNYRQLKNIELDFNAKTESDLHIIIGKNGAGKSNILNAINWCLYYEEPHLNDDSKALPLLNIETIRNADEGDIRNVKVELTTQSENDIDIIFTRQDTYRILKDGEKPFKVDAKFEVMVINSNSNTEIYEDDAATECVNRFVPNGIREYFFFDGERLDKYFTSATGPKIRNAIFEISQVHLLETIENRLSKIHADLRKLATKDYPDKNKINNEYDSLVISHNECKQDIINCNKQIETSKTIIEECEEYLRGLPDIELEEKNREKLISQNNVKQQQLNKKLLQEQTLLREYTTLINLYPQICEVSDIIKEKKQNNELPPVYDRNLLESALDNDHCIVCNQNLSTDSKQYINNILNQIKVSSNVSQTLLSMESSLYTFKEKAHTYNSSFENIRSDINMIREDLETNQLKISDIDKKLSGYKDKEEIKEKHNKRAQHEKLREINMKKLASQEFREKELAKKIELKDKQLRDVMKNDSKLIKLNNQKEFCEKALKALKLIKDSIMNENRLKIENETQNTFLSFLWKKDTFKEISISDNYNISLTHIDNYECLGSCSAAEKALLALSFTLSLHKVSGFLSPLVIDTPISRVSDTNRENFANVLADVSKNKQIILLFTRSEYSEEISNTFDSIVSQKYILEPRQEIVTYLK